MSAIVPVLNPNTLGGMMAAVTRFHKEDEDPNFLIDAINDAIDSLWRSILLVNLSQFMGGPVTNLTIAAGAERASIVSITDPTVAPVIAPFVDGTLGAHTITGCYTYITESGSETLPSPTTTLLIAANSVAQITPPAYNNSFDPGIVGWNFYADLSGGARLAKQNGEPIDIYTKWTEPSDTGTVEAPDAPRPPNSNTTADNIFYIRTLEVQNPDSTWTTWHAGNLDDLLMRRASRDIGAATTYQGYAYDVLNGNTIEIRPAAGMTYNPRYFYVKKPRRLRFQSSLIPFTNFNASEFVKAYTEGQLCLSNHEYTASERNFARANNVRQEVLLGMNTQATTKQKTITPYFGW